MISESDRWLDLELRHFAALHAIASEGSFRGAAVRLGYTQSAISQQIAAMERIVGQQLIHRPGGPRPVTLTESGSLLLRHVDAVLARVNAAQADFATLAAGGTGTLRVGTYQSVSRRLIPYLVKEFAQTWPQVEIRLTESESDGELLDGVERGDLDLAFAILPLPPGPFAFVELMTDQYVIVAAADSPLARQRRPFNLTVITGMPLIGFRKCRTFELIESHLHTVGLAPEIVFRSDDNGTIQALVAAGMGIALVPRLTVDESDPQTVIIEMEDTLPARHVLLAWHRDRYQTQVAQSFVESAQRLCQELNVGLRLVG